MRVRNPNHVRPRAPNVPADFDARIDALLASDNAKRAFTFDEIKAVLNPADPNRIPDGVVHQLLIDKGLEVEVDEG